MKGLRQVGLATAILTDEEINYIDTKIVETVRPILIGRSLFPVSPLGHAGYRIVTFYTQGDMSAAVIDMDGQQESQDLAPLSPETVKIPVIHKETALMWRDLAMARANGTPIDVAQAKNAARQVAEEEDMLLLTGHTLLHNFLGIEGLLSATGRNTTAGGEWVDMTAPATPVLNCLAYISAAITELETDGHYGPYKLLLTPTARARLRCADTALDQWAFKSVGDLIGGVENILVSPNLYAADDGIADSAAVIEPGEDNFDLLVGEDMHTINHIERNKNIWLQVREVVAPRIRRPAAICEITGLLFAT